jgi:hypothetical protein
MNTATMIQSLIDTMDDVEGIADEIDETAQVSSSKKGNFGNIQFGARFKTWSFPEIEERADLDPMYRNFQRFLLAFLVANGFEFSNDHASDQVHCSSIYSWSWKSDFHSDRRLSNIGILKYSMNQR